MSYRQSLQASILVLLATPCLAQKTYLASVDSSGGLANGRSEAPVISEDGTCIAFHSVANNLVPGDTNGFTFDVFVHVPETGQTTRVSVSSSGSQANGSSGYPSLSRDGRHVAFGSTATNLVTGDQNDAGDVFMHDRVTGLTTRLSVDSNGNEGDLGSGRPSVSADGRMVAFSSSATNLVPGDDNLAQDIFHHDRLTGVTTRVSVSSNGIQANDACYEPIISGDGQSVAFFSTSDTLVPGDSNGVADIFVHDVTTGTTTRVSVDSAGNQADGGSWNSDFSHDGRLVVFNSVAPNLVAGDANGVGDVFLHDRSTGATSLISIDSAGAHSDNYSEDPFISADGRHVAFRSLAANLVPGDTNDGWDVFVHDRLLGLTVRSSVDSLDEQGNDFSQEPSLSANGRYIAFGSWASNLIGGDTNDKWDIFLRDRPVAGGGSMCTGDGTGNVCPCGNLGAAGEGCANSLGHGGMIGRYGTMILGNNDLRFASEQLPPGAVAVLFAGQAAVGGGSGILLGDGIRCAGGGIVRLGACVVDASGTATWGPNLAPVGRWIAGDTRYFQVWYQDPSGSPCGTGFNLTPVHEMSFRP